MDKLYKSQSLTAYMFSKKIKCRCGKKVDKKFEYCPYCGNDLNETITHNQNRDKHVDALMKDFEKAFNMPFLMKFPFESLVKKMVKDIDDQFQEYDKELSQNNPHVIKSGISISINQGPDGDPVIKVNQFGPGKNMQINDMRQLKEAKETKEKRLPQKFSYNNEKVSKLPKQEPETTVRRLTDRIIYEISIPGVKNDKNLFINKLQNSIEIRAFSDKQAYFKLIPIALPIIDWKFSEEKLILELKL